MCRKKETVQLGGIRACSSGPQRLRAGCGVRVESRAKAHAARWRAAGRAEGQRAWRSADGTRSNGCECTHTMSPALSDCLTVLAKASFEVTYPFHQLLTSAPSPPCPPACWSGTWLCSSGQSTVNEYEKCALVSWFGRKTAMHEFSRSRLCSATCSFASRSAVPAGSLGTPMKTTSRSSEPIRWRPPCTEVASSEPSSHEPHQVPSCARLTLNGSWCCTTSSRAEGPPDASSAAATAEAELPGGPAVAGAELPGGSAAASAAAGAAAVAAVGLEQLAMGVSCPGEERWCEAQMELSSEGCSMTLGSGGAPPRPVRGGSESSEPQSAITCTSSPPSTSRRLCGSGSHLWPSAPRTANLNSTSPLLCSLSSSGSTRQMG